MYSQGNYGPQYRSPGPPGHSYQQQQQGLPPPPLPPYQPQGLPVPPPYQQNHPTMSVTPSLPTHGGLTSSSRPPIQPGHPPPPGIMNAGQPYFNKQSPLVHESSLVATTSFQTSQQAPPPYMPPQNVHHSAPPISRQPGLPLAGTSAPPPPRLLPPPPPPPVGQVLFRTMNTPPPLAGNMQMPQPVRSLPPPPPPHPGFVLVAQAPYALYVHNSSEEAHLPSVPPPPPPPLPPSSPPPLPPSSPPPSSPPVPPNIAAAATATATATTMATATATTSGESAEMPLDTVSEAPDHNDSVSCSVMKLDYTERATEQNNRELSGNARLIDHPSTPDGRIHGEVATRNTMDSLKIDGSSSEVDALVCLPSPPPKPEDAEVTRNIEVLCQFIAKVGPDFENLARTKEADNPKFSFLFGGEPGSAASVGHEYFLWMKKKCEIEIKFKCEQLQNDAISRPSDNESSRRSSCSVHEDASASPAPSDMDTEDDVSHPEGIEGMYQPAEDITNKTVSRIHKARPARKQVISPQSSMKSHKEEAKLLDTICTESSQQVSGRAKEDGQSSFEDLSPARCSVEDAELTSSTGFQEPAKPIEEDLSPVKASLATGSCKNEDNPRLSVNDGSSFKLIQDYASDDSAEDDRMASVNDVRPVRGLPGLSFDSEGINANEGMGVCISGDSKKISGTELRSHKASVMASSTKLDEPTSVVKCEDTTVNKKTGSVVALESAISQQDLEHDSQSGKNNREEDVKPASASLNVDEFGRLVREATSDSDSDETHYSRRFGKRARSRSPSERRWRRSRSPRRRRDRQSRSCSRSPKKQRSRSRSPLIFRRSGEFNSEKSRRENRSQPPDCLDFRRGKCYRGASCRYLHRDSTYSDASRWSRRKREQYHEPNVDKSVLHEDAYDVAEAHDSKNIKRELDFNGHEILQDETKCQEVQTMQDLPLSATRSVEHGRLDEKSEINIEIDGLRATTSSEFVQSLVPVTSEEILLPEGPKEVDARAPETQVHEVKEGQSIHFEDKSDGERLLEIPECKSTPTAKTRHVLSEVSAVEPPSSNISCSVAPSLHVDGSLTSHSSTIHGHPFSQRNPSQEIAVSPQPNQVPMNQSYPFQVSASQLILTETVRQLPHLPHSVSSVDNKFQYVSPSLPPSTSLPYEQNHEQPLPSLQPHSFAADYHSQNMPYAKPLWTGLSPPPSSFANKTMRPAIPSTDFHLSQFQQTLMPTRDGIPAQPLMRNHLSDDTRVYGYQHHSFPYMDADNRQEQSYRHHIYTNEGQLGRTEVPHDSEFISKPVQGHNLHHPLHGEGRVLYSGSVDSRPPSFPRELSSRHVQAFPGDNLSHSIPRENFYDTVNNFSFSRQQYSSYASELPVAGSFSSNVALPTNPNSSLLRYPIGLDAAPKVSSSTHYNPFASTFEQTPSGSKFGSGFLRQEINSNYDSKLGKELTGSDQYDPLFDSIEPPSKMVKKLDSSLGQSSAIRDGKATRAVQTMIDSISTLKPSCSNAPHDVEDNNKQKDGAVAIPKPVENDDFDGAADAEIGVVENVSPQPEEGKNWSPDVPDNMGNAGDGDFEIDEVQTSGKSKNKDSRLMKLFKIAIADFVKEVLKPSWRQGNMSKEAFKTIVKKTVDKVSGAMKNHQIPRSQAKINQYVESSQRKLTKLVMGYVDKYVKV